MSHKIIRPKKSGVKGTRVAFNYPTNRHYAKKNKKQSMVLEVMMVLFGGEEVQPCLGDTQYSSGGTGNISILWSES